MVLDVLYDRLQAILGRHSSDTRHTRPSNSTLARTNTSQRTRRHTRDRRSIRAKVSRRKRRDRRARPILLRQKPRLDKHRNDRAGSEREFPMPENPQNTPDLAAVRRDREPSVVVIPKDIVEYASRSRVLSSQGLGEDAGPKLIFLCETGLDGPFWEEALNVSLAVSTVTGVRGDSLTEQLLHHRNERELVG